MCTHDVLMASGQQSLARNTIVYRALKHCFPKLEAQASSWKPAMSPRHSGHSGGLPPPLLP